MKNIIMILTVLVSLLAMGMSAFVLYRTETNISKMNEQMSSIQKYNDDMKKWETEQIDRLYQWNASESARYKEEVSRVMDKYFK